MCSSLHCNIDFYNKNEIINNFLGRMLASKTKPHWFLMFHFFVFSLCLLYFPFHIDIFFIHCIMLPKLYIALSNMVSPYLLFKLEIYIYMNKKCLNWIVNLIINDMFRAYVWGRGCNRGEYICKIIGDGNNTIKFTCNMFYERQNNVKLTVKRFRWWGYHFLL